VVYDCLPRARAFAKVEYRALLLAVHEISFGSNVNERIKDMLVQTHHEMKRYKKLRLVTQKVGGENGAPVRYKRKSVILKREMTQAVNRQRSGARIFALLCVCD
jgi:hypothetical protein